MLWAHAETAWGLSLAAFELGGSLGIGWGGRRPPVPGDVLNHPGLFWSVHPQCEQPNAEP